MTRFAITMLNRLITLAFIGVVALGMSISAHAGENFITLASTTSTKNSGLYDFILPRFTEQSGIDVRVVAVGTGQAIRMSKNGDADVMLVHHKKSELAFVAEGFGVERFDVMYNDFVVIGPETDPAAVRGSTDVVAALKKIAADKFPFASRGDDSGTNKKELSLWQTAGVDVKALSGSWYRETGSGMGATLNAAAGMNAYVLSDRSTWLKFANKGDLSILVEGDKRLYNQYGVILVNPARHGHVKVTLGQAFIDWITGSEGQALIAQYRIEGRQAFFPNANKPNT